MTEHDETPATIDETAEPDVTGDETTEPGESIAETAELDATSEETEAVAEGTDLATIRELVLRAHPDVVPELIAGESIEALLESVGPAEAAFQRLAERFRQPATLPPAPSVPAGGDRSVPIDPERLPTSEKILRGLASRRQ